MCLEQRNSRDNVSAQETAGIRNFAPQNADLPVTPGRSGSTRAHYFCKAIIDLIISIDHIKLEEKDGRN